MFSSNILDVAVGLVFVFLLLSLISSAANELIETFLKRRAVYLEKGIRELVGSTSLATSKDFVQKIYEHGLINALYRGDYVNTPKSELPSYIPARNFALAVIDIWKSRDKLGVALPANVEKAMNAFEKVAEGKAAVFRQEVENWYNSSMDRVSGWYKRRTQVIVLLLGTTITILVNADCIAIAKRLSTDTNMRQAATRLAENTAKQNAQGQSAQGSTTGNQSQSDVTLSEIRKNLDSLAGIGLPLGWDPTPKSMGDVGRGIAGHWIGWLITALAVSLGAPFWFDVLNKIIVVRSTVKPAEKSGAEASKDATTSSQKPMVLTVQAAAPAAPAGNPAPAADQAPDAATDTDGGEAAPPRSDDGQQ
jgi:hypothetical protein